MHYKIILFLLFFFTTHQFAIAQEKIDSLIQLVDTTRIDTSTIDLYYLISDEYKETDIQKAIEFSQKGLKIAELIQDSGRMVRGNLKLGTNMTMLSYYHQALDKYTECMKIAKIKKDTNLLGEVLNNIGNIYWFQENYQLAIKYYYEALTFSTKAKNHELITGLNLNLAIVYQNLFNYDSAEYFFDKSLQLAKAANDSSEIALILLNMTDSKSYKSNSSKIASRLKEAHIYENNLSMHLKSILYGNYASYDLNTRNFQSALNHLQISKKLANESKSIYALRYYFETKFMYDTSIGDYKSAVQTNNLLIAINDSIFNNEIANKTANLNTLYEINKKENEIEILKARNELNELKNKQNKLKIEIILVVFIFALIIMMVVIKSNRLKNKSIDTLNEYNLKLKASREEMTALNEELSMNQEELFEKNRNLESTITQLRTVQNKLIQSEKIASIGILARGVAHELINPLNFISGGIAILQDNQSEDVIIQQKTEFPMQMMTEGIERAVDIVKQLGTFIDQGNSLPQPTDIRKILKSTLVFINYKIDLETQLVEEYGEVGDIICYPDKLHAAMFQLLTYSIDAVKVVNTKKTIKISTSLVEKENNTFVEIKIFYSGKPINETMLQKIFDPHYVSIDTEKEIDPGLISAYNLLKEQNGTLKAQNLVDGVLFTIQIPKMG